jgi:hypothetical protein
VVGLTVPTIISTKLQWYLNHSYPVFALGVAALVVNGLSADYGRRRRVVLAVTVVVVLLTAESRLLWYSYHYRDLSRSPQGLLLAERPRLAGHRVFRSRWDRAEIFVLGGVVGADRGLAAGREDFLQQSRPGDYWMVHHEENDPRLALVASGPRNHLYQRRW